MNILKENKHTGYFGSYLKSIFRDTGRSIRRNKLMSVASVLSIGAALIILGIFVIFSSNLNHITKNVESALELKVYVQSGLSQDQIDQLNNKLGNHQNVTKVTYVSADQALQDFSESLGDYSGLLSGYNSSNNPMPASFNLKISSADKITTVKKFAESLKADGVTEVKYGEEYVDALVSFSHFSNIFSTVLIVVLSVVSVFIIYNTIKLTCFARRKEIRVMRYVGATDWFIRSPFVLEGTVLGAIGAIVALAIIWSGYRAAMAYVARSVYLPMHSSLVAPGSIMGPLIVFCLVYGIVIGAIGSVASIRKFLDA